MDPPAQILLVRAESPSKLHVSVRGPKGPLDATVALEGPQSKELALTGGEGEADLQPGTYRLRVTATGHLSREASATVTQGQVASVNFELARKPKSTALVIQKDRILTRRTIQFRTGESEILQESYSILDEVAAAIIDNNYRHVRVEGHTDNVGGKAKNQRLSEGRAAAVRDYLVNQAGIDASRVDSAGFGDTKPVAPNLTERGKAMNRRVEFAIGD
jgi:outer membrane protein OmpA-like peptidoglycan-associated protein